MGVLSRQSLQFIINVGSQNTLRGNQGTPTQSAARSVVMAMLEKKRDKSKHDQHETATWEKRLTGCTQGGIFI